MGLLQCFWLYAVLLTVPAAILPALRLTLLQFCARILIACIAAYHLAVGVYNIFIYPFYVSPLRHLPGPKDHHFLLGHALNQIRSGDPTEPYTTWMRTWPGERFIRAIGFGHSDGLLVTRIDAFREIFQTKADLFIKPKFHTRIITPITGVGVVFSEGEEHKSQRRFLSPPMSIGKIKRMLPVFQQKSQQLVQLFDQLAESGGGVVDVSDVYARVTLDVIVLFTMGLDMDVVLKDSIFRQSFHQTFDPSPFGLLLVGISAFVPAIRYLPLEENRKFNNAISETRARIRNIIRQRRAEINAGKVDIGAEPDMLTYMLMEQSVEDPWPEDKIMDNVLNFMVAGYETSGNTLTWATNRLCIRPDIQDKLRAEVQGLLARKPNPDYADLEGLRYLDNFCKESLRFQASGIMAAREATEDVEVCGTLIPKGTSLLMIPHIINRNPAIWGDDVDEFKPDRWDNLSGDARDPFALATFLFGPRSCMGRVFAMLEMKMVLVEVLSKFRFEPEVEQEDIVLVNPCPALRVSGGLKVRVRRREE
ncbi:Cytochrome P450 709B2 [Colletotrichum musicola]|uniref:Cytochrome P450 709B2 n=1 Tax=Colletotrichum musicola TaxID=2175873 RepID=A0A8H6N7A0_9PEZI|nr:Cytochrome P450 709B2 [Colletotrichum musicola]